MKSSDKIFLIVLGIVMIAGGLAVFSVNLIESSQSHVAGVAASAKLPFSYSFSNDGTLYETGNIVNSASSYWWVNSGAFLKIESGIGETSMGELPRNWSWRLLYAKNNPNDTDGGFHPQNIFRLPTRAIWQDVLQEVYFRIEKTNISTSTNRNASNGLLLFSRYQDGNNLYYLGIRVDGTAVIKKKINGKYFTLAQKQVFSGTWNVNSNPNLLPEKTWIGIRSFSKTEGNSVRLILYTDVGRTGHWTEVASTTDGGISFGGSAFVGAGRGGIRTDFMDVSFDDYLVQSIP